MPDPYGQGQVKERLKEIDMAMARERMEHSYISRIGKAAALKTPFKKSGPTPATALGFMVFVLIYTPCIVTIITIFKETGSVGWTVFVVSYLLVLAWIMAFAIKWGCFAIKCL
ncbi:MAG: hypothetical protein ACUVQ6_05640 [Dissulfurimicrobium sp.]|uniref:hypothetical protein n=1 Tax=Dissulfurimicrobium sp. TaxID=2022436 RepID=UPI00404B99C8